MRKINLSKIEHRGMTRIKVTYERDADFITKIKTIHGRRWSKTKKCWHLPYSKESFEQLKIVFGESNLSLPEKAKPDVTSPQKSEIAYFVFVEPEHDYRVKVFVPWHKKDWIALIKSLPNRAWNKKDQYWSLPKTEKTLLQLKTSFGEHLQMNKSIDWKKNERTNPFDPVKSREVFNKIFTVVDENTPFPNDDFLEKKENKSHQSIENQSDKKFFKTIMQYGKMVKVVVGGKIIIEKANEKWLRIFVPFDKKGWIDFIKNINGRRWNKEGVYWLVPYVKDTIDRLEIIGVEYIEYTFEVSKNIPEHYSFSSKKEIRVKPFDQLNAYQQKAIIALEEKLLFERYSYRTISSYKNNLIGLFLFYPKILPSQISTKQITDFILGKIKTKKISESTQNQLINALKTFYKKVLNQDKVQNIVRPRKSKKLPHVFSKEEMELLLNGIKNQKHRAMISLIYSAGLRRGEILNLRVKDILFSRKCIFVKNAKGKKDRYVMLAPKIAVMIRKYIKMYRPTYWLFEGQIKGQYSASSLQSIFNAAKEKSKVNPSVTIHGLRHSFATHLHESGIPLMAIKDLLGHRSIKTTEIYIHLSNKYRKEIQSPFEDLNLD